MAAVSECAIHRKFTRFRRQHLEDLGQQNRHVLTGRRLPRGPHFSDGLGVLIGIELFVFVLKTNGILPGITRAAAMGGGGGIFSGARFVTHDATVQRAAR